MSLATAEIVQQLHPAELEYVMERALSDGPFTVESIQWNGQEKDVVVKYRTGRTRTIAVPLWKLRS
jgi:hypothetical protein